MEPINPSVAISRAFSATHTQIQAALNNLANQQAYVEETLLQHEQQVIAEYNEAVAMNEQLNSELDSKDQAISALRIEIHDIKEQQADFETRALVAEKNASKTESKLVAERLRASDAERELKRLKELNPERLGLVHWNEYPTTPRPRLRQGVFVVFNMKNRELFNSCR